jgi:hypothetical protein
MPADDGLRLFQGPEQVQAVTMFLARLFCFDEIAPCDACAKAISGCIADRAYETLRAAMHEIGTPFSDRARFFGVLQTASVTLPPNTKDEDDDEDSRNM